MRTFLVSYDLANPDLNQPYIADAIMRLGEAWARPLANVWYLRASETPAEIESRLARWLGDEDGLLIQETRGEVVLCNAGLRWFRQRRASAIDRADCDNVVAFPVPGVAADQREAAATPVRAAG